MEIPSKVDAEEDKSKGEVVLFHVLVPLGHDLFIRGEGHFSLSFSFPTNRFFLFFGISFFLFFIFSFFCFPLLKRCRRLGKRGMVKGCETQVRTLFSCRALSKMPLRVHSNRTCQCRHRVIEMRGSAKKKINSKKKCISHSSSLSLSPLSMKDSGTETAQCSL